jgi:hypothetical protein
MAPEQDQDSSPSNSETPGEMHAAAFARQSRRAVRDFSIGAAVLIALGFVLYWRAMAPVHGVRDVSGCERAYSAARTRTDTLSVDLMSYPNSIGRRVNRLCGMLRPTPVSLIQRHGDNSIYRGAWTRGQQNAGLDAAEPLPVPLHNWSTPWRSQET